MIADYVWLLVADQVQYPRAFYSLCLVSKRFNAIFSPYLYHHITLYGIHLKHLRCISQSPYISFTRSLQVCCLDLSLDGQCFFDMLDQMGNLRTLQLRGVEIPKTVEGRQILHRLQSLPPRLQSLSIEADEYSWKPIDDLSLPWFLPDTLRLGHLELTALPLGFVERNLSSLADLLKTWPVQRLQLSLDHEPWRKNSLLSDLIGLFDGDQPLALRDLHLGAGFLPLKQGDNGADLGQLTDLACLEVLGLQNGDCAYDSSLHLSSSCVSLIHAARSLHTLRLCRLSDEMVDFITSINKKNKPSVVTSLVVHGFQQSAAWRRCGTHWKGIGLSASSDPQQEEEMEKIVQEVIVKCVHLEELCIAIPSTKKDLLYTCLDALPNLRRLHLLPGKDDDRDTIVQEVFVRKRRLVGRGHQPLFSLVYGNECFEYLWGEPYQVVDCGRWTIPTASV
ncbi:hypothetical protein ASPZODRAFT_170120 [Penicilliopsis zonata CBS 506.65]|uniref:F-box domain-containing protein n=1 Tax=Penicilliopsis zonata CBS 506.65 TaxID=1073090 RepID=A0A1L9S5L5_9EURO|nr:hypothetical protein ASPZODRAFT_170120 [Penicilliopsis zonata CBS 506.65]OJJ42447.1 hypothetical protein ASPZODRAFT_170120 [Penicilliopsis zonata CBS 506.65]